MRDYFGEKIAFYFAWMEHYTIALFFLALGSALFIHAEDNVVLSILYCSAVALWTTVYSESWRRSNAELAYKWSVQTFEQEEMPRPEFLAAFHGGGGPAKRWRNEKGVMRYEPGFFADDGRFVKEASAPLHIVFPMLYRFGVKFAGLPIMLLMLFLMMIVTLSILTFRMLWTISTQFNDGSETGVAANFNAETGRWIGSFLNTFWVMFMNKAYKGVAKYLNDMENYRTETEYNDALIMKTFLFQFFNSYSALFYLAFIKGMHIPLFGAFGYRDQTSNELYAEITVDIVSRRG